LEDFTYLLKFPGQPNIHVREITPKDFYYAQILRNKSANNLDLIERLVLSREEFYELPSSYFHPATKWMYENLLQERVYTVENWLEVAFHLCKQRWGESIDWLERQPISKIQAMIQVVEKFAEEQEEQIKRSARSG
jgi:hypothetical protein